MMMPTRIEFASVDKIKLLGKSVEELFKRGNFPDQMYSLLELRTEYHDPRSGLASNIHGSHETHEFGEGEWLADAISTRNARKLPRGFLKVRYVQKPHDAIKSLKTGYSTSGGNVIVYACPPSGFAIPADGMLYHPETGAAIATISDRKKAAKLVAKYIGQHPEQFSHMKISRRWKNILVDYEDEESFDPSNPTPAQLADLVTSYQLSPDANSGVVGVYRGFWNHSDGPFHLLMNETIGSADTYVGVRLRSEV